MTDEGEAMTETGCGHPNHGKPDHDCAPFVTQEHGYGETADADMRPASDWPDTRVIPPENDAFPGVRELTVGQLVERLQTLPSHHYVSPMVDGVLGAGIDVWQMFDPQTHDTLVVFGEPKSPTSPIVPPSWSRETKP